MDEDKLSKQFETYQQLAQQDKKIDVASLMIAALQTQQHNMLTNKEKRWAYLIAISLPPLGLGFAVKFWVSGKDDGKEAAWMCVILTAVSVLSFVFLGSFIFHGSGTSLNQIQQIKPSDIQQLTQ